MVSTPTLGEAIDYAAVMLDLVGLGSRSFNAPQAVTGNDSDRRPLHDC